jgi:hypothetical protein
MTIVYKSEISSLHYIKEENIFRPLKQPPIDHLDHQTLKSPT